MFLLKFLNITDKRYLNALSQAGTIGLHMVSGIVVGGGIGYGLDKWLKTEPVCLLIFLAVGIVAGFKNVYVDTRRLLAAQKREDEEYFAASSSGSSPADAPAASSKPDTAENEDKKFSAGSERK